jgi:hypothetical protein
MKTSAFPIADLVGGGEMETKRILIVDDNDLIREILMEFL